MSNYKELSECIACGGSNLRNLFDLGEQPLANSYHEGHEVQEKYPLGLNHCTDCHHLQLTHVVNPSLLFDDYLYVSGTTKTLHDYFKWFSAFASAKYRDWVSNWSLEQISVLDIACNDGTQLDYFKALGDTYTTVGVDPAKNLYSISSKKHRVICNYFSRDLFDFETEDQRFDIVVAQNVFAHTEDAYGFLRDCAHVMNRHGLLFIQTSQAEMVKSNQFDTIYHEHLSFFNINSMKAICDRAGMHLVDVIKVPVHGISYVFVISPAYPFELMVRNHLELERIYGLMKNSTYNLYSNNVKAIISTLRDTLKHMPSTFTLVGYGAAAKGMTVLNSLRLPPDKLPKVIIDDNPMKVGLYTPGTDIPIVGVDYLKTLPPDEKVVFMPLAWNFFDEIRSRIREVRDAPTDMFIKYFPDVRVTSNE